MKDVEVYPGDSPLSEEQIQAVWEGEAKIYPLDGTVFVIPPFSWEISEKSKGNS